MSIVVTTTGTSISAAAAGLSAGLSLRTQKMKFTTQVLTSASTTSTLSASIDTSPVVSAVCVAQLATKKWRSTMRSARPSGTLDRLF